MHDVRCTYCICQELEGEQSWRSTNPANIDPGWVGGGGGTNMGGILPLKMQRVSRGTNQIIITSAKRQKEPLILADDACELLNKFNIVFVIFCFGFFLQGDEKSMR